MPKGTDEGVSVAADAVPVPERLAVCGLPLASSVTVKVAVRAADAVGVNVTLMVQLELSAGVEGGSAQLFDWPKSPGFVPPTAMLLMVSGAVPVFESVTACGALVVPPRGAPPGSDEGVSVAADAVPVPERLAVCGLPLASSVTVKVA